MVETAIHRNPSGLFPLEWRLQALVVACNALPVLVLAAGIAYVSLAAAVPTGLFSLFVGGFFDFLVLGYAVLCLIISNALWRRSGRARFAAIAVLVLYLLIYGWASTVKRPEPAPTPAYLKGRKPAFQVPPWVTRAAWAGNSTLHLLPLLNIVAITHLALRWRQFSKSANSRQPIEPARPTR